MAVPASDPGLCRVKPGEVVTRLGGPLKGALRRSRVTCLDFAGGLGRRRVSQPAVDRI